MSELAMTRLLDLAQAGYQIDCHHSSRDRLVLEHIGRGPGIELLMCGTIVARDAPLWPPNIPRPDRIEKGEDVMFAEFIFEIVPPQRFQEITFCLRRAMSLLPMAASFRHWVRSIHWFAVEQFR